MTLITIKQQQLEQQVKSTSQLGFVQVINQQLLAIGFVKSTSSPIATPIYLLTTILHSAQAALFYYYLSTNIHQSAAQQLLLFAAAAAIIAAAAAAISGHHHWQLTDHSTSTDHQFIGTTTTANYWHSTYHWHQVQFTIQHWLAIGWQLAVLLLSRLQAINSAYYQIYILCSILFQWQQPSTILTN